MSERVTRIRFGQDPRPKRLDGILRDIDRRLPHPWQEETREAEKQHALMMFYAEHYRD